VAHHRRGSQDHGGDRIAPLSHQLLGEKLGLVVAVLEALAEIEIFLAEGARVLPHHRDGAGVAEALQRTHLAHEIEQVSRALHVDAHRDLARRREVVEGRQVDHMGDATPHLIGDGRLETQPGLADVAGKHLHALALGGILDCFVQVVVESLQEAALFEQKEVAVLLLEVVRQDVAADEAAGAGAEQCLLALGSHGWTHLQAPSRRSSPPLPPGSRSRMPARASNR
jgi:hypothetical protein